MPKILPNIRTQNITQKTAFFWIVFSIFSWGYAAKTNSQKVDLSYSTINPQTIQLDLPPQDKGIGGLITADVNDDSKKDFIITKPLWRRDDFLANAHNGARVADLDGDGQDEVLGGTIVAPDGKVLSRIPLKGHIDSLFVADVRPDIPGLEEDP